MILDPWSNVFCLKYTGLNAPKIETTTDRLTDSLTRVKSRDASASKNTIYVLHILQILHILHFCKFCILAIFLMLHNNYYISVETNLNLLKCQTLHIIQIVCKILESRIFCIICKFCIFFILTIVLPNCLIL